MMMTPLSGRNPGKQEEAESFSVAAPVKGWNTRDPEANMGPLYATILDNWMPQAGKITLRPGVQDYATGATSNIKSLMTWNGQSSSKLFAFQDSGIYDVTATGTVWPALSLTRTEGYNCGINFTTTGGHYLVTVNGVDDLAYYNGTAWATAASFVITSGGTLNSKDIWNINSFKRSIYFIKKNSMSFFFLPIDSIAGDVGEFPLGALFNKGGYLVAMGTWTIDGGNGPEDYSVFISSKGEAAVYAGTDPSDASTWALKGIYDMDPPLGRKCFSKFGGDLLLLTQRGLFSMTATLKNGKMDPRAAFTDVIGEAFREISNATGEQEGWEVHEYAEQNVLFVNLPLGDYATSCQFVMNTKTNAWSRFRGWSGYSFSVMGSSIYMAMTEKVAKAFVEGANDFEASITCEAQQAFNYASPRSRMKDWLMLRVNLRIAGICAVNLALETDFSDNASFGSAVFNTTASSRWDSARWDEARWSAGAVLHNDWVTVPADASYCAAICLRTIARNATVTWTATDMLYNLGALA